MEVEKSFYDALHEVALPGYQQLYSIRLESLGPLSKGYWYYSSTEKEFREVVGYLSKYWPDGLPVYGKTLDIESAFRDYKDGYDICLARIPKQSHKDHYTYKVFWPR